MKNKTANQLNEKYKTPESAAAIDSLKSLKAEPSPYLTQRILNNLELKNQAQQKQSAFSVKDFFTQFKFWPSISVALATLFICFFGLKAFNKNNEFPSQVYALGQDYVIRMDVRPLPNNEIAYAEISLSDENIQFSSKKYSELKMQKKLVVNWESMVEKQYLPIVVQGTKAGSSKVIVNFYDSEHKLVTTQEISLYFKKGGA